MFKIEQPIDLPKNQDKEWVLRATKAIKNDDLNTLGSLAKELETLSKTEKKKFIDDELWKKILHKVKVSKSIDEKINAYRLYLEKTKLSIYEREASQKIQDFENEQILWKETVQSVKRKQKHISKINELEDYLEKTKLNLYNDKAVKSIEKLKIEKDLEDKRDREDNLKRDIELEQIRVDSLVKSLKIENDTLKEKIKIERVKTANYSEKLLVREDELSITRKELNKFKEENSLLRSKNYKLRHEKEIIYTVLGISGVLILLGIAIYYDFWQFLIALGIGFFISIMLYEFFGEGNGLISYIVPPLIILGISIPIFLYDFFQIGLAFILFIPLMILYVFFENR